MFVWTSALIYAAGVAINGFAHEFHAFLLGTAVAGFGQGVYLAVDLALVVEVLPNKVSDAAKDMGISNLANALPSSIAPATAPFFLAWALSQVPTTIRRSSLLRLCSPV